MTLGLMATKVGMTQIYINDGVRVPVTVLKVEPNIVTSKRTHALNGYSALQVGTGAIREKLVNKPDAGHFKKNNVAALRHLMEFRVSEEKVNEFEIGGNISLDILKDVGSVDISGISKGKGFAGVMKRHNFSGFPASRGTHETFRGPGSIGQRSQPGKVFKGMKMAGHMGDERVTTLNLRVVRIMEEEGLVLVRGAVPGGKNSLVEIRPSTRRARAFKLIGGVVVDDAKKNPMKASKAKK